MWGEKPAYALVLGRRTVSIMGGHSEHSFIGILHKKIDITWQYRKTGRSAQRRPAIIPHYGGFVNR
jgi:hypothetical protein